jgi:hypothetical protein
MQHALRALALCILIIASAMGADPLSVEPRDGVLVLRNGFTLPGRITLIGDTYLVSFGDRGEARLPSSDVEFECRSLDEAYRMKRDTLESDDSQHHLRLADWCMRHGIMAGAADQLLITRVLDPTHPALGSLEKRFESLAAMTATAAKTATVTAATTAPNAFQTPMRASQASHTEAMPSAASRDIEPFLVQQFTVTVHPILLNRCATHACHGAGGSTGYRLLRPSLGQASTSRLTNKNLQATLAFIDREQPESSRFLAMAREPHGGVAIAQFEDKAATQLDLIQSWVRRLGMRFPNTNAAKRPVPPRALNAATTAIASKDNAPIGGSTSEPATADSTAQSPDPLDPQEFNRRFHGKP